MNVRKLISAIALATALAGCNGHDDDIDDGFESAGDPQTVVVNGQNGTPIQYAFTSAGIYELRVTGEIACQASPAVLNVWFSFSGLGAITDGDPMPAYEMINCVTTAKFTQNITVSVDGSGPWQVGVQVFGPSWPGFTVYDLQLKWRRVSAH